MAEREMSKIVHSFSPKLPVLASLGLILFMLTTMSSAQVAEQRCLDRLQAQAKSEGIRAQTIANVFPGIEIRQRVLELDRKQPEFTTTFADYIGRRVTATRVDKGRQLYQQHKTLLQKITAATGVPGHYLVAFWGMETNYGGYLGRVSTMNALATLACDQRRSRYFSREFIAALKLIDNGDVDPQIMKGSWAGAMGHVQFMPSVYLRYAMDGDGDKRRDLWGSLEDALWSAANYLRAEGWESGLRWGREVLLSEQFPFHEVGLSKPKSLKEWKRLGVKDAFGRELPELDISASVIVPAGHKGPSFLVYKNFKVIMRWNRSESYAISVGHLADRIAGAGSFAKAPPADALRLTKSLIKTVQAKLNEIGYNAGEPDGIFGPASRNALRSYQHAKGRIADGYIDSDVLSALQVPYEVN